MGDIRCRLEIFLILALVVILFCGWNCLGNFDRWSYEEYLVEISLNLVLAVQEQLFKDLFLFLALAAIIFSGSGPFEGLKRNIWVEFKLAFQKTLFSGHFVL